MSAAQEQGTIIKLHPLILQCVYAAPNLPCEHCTLHNLPDCIKRLGPKTEARLSPPTPIKVTDPSISHADVACLQYLYSNNTKILCGSIKLDVLARLCGRVYGLAIGQRGLRHMIIAILMSKSRSHPQVPEALDNPKFDALPSETEQRHIDIVMGDLTKKLSNPADVEESDILVAYLLAVWSEDVDSSATDVHIEGVIAIMRHLQRKMGDSFSTSPMAPFWALLRDEILWRKRKSPSFYRLCQEFRDILGPKTVQQRQRYERELRAAMMVDIKHPNPKIFFGRTMYSSIHTLMESAKIINERFHYQRTDSDPLIESVLVELHVEQVLLEQRGHESLLELELRPLNKGHYVEDWKVELTIIERLHDLIAIYVCRLATLGLEARTVTDGLESTEGQAAAAMLKSVIKRARAFLHAGMRGERVYGTGSNFVSPF
jgi:hypothetical protein